MGTEPGAAALELLMADETGATIARELGVTAPADFVAARTAAATLLTESGQPALAKAVRALRRPTRSAWLVNVLASEQAGAVADLVALHPTLARAHVENDVTAMRTASAERARLVGTLLGEVARLAAARDARPTASVLDEVEQTLLAAVADPAIGRLVSLGVLDRAQRWSGFGVALGGASPTADDAGTPTPRAVRPREREDAVTRAEAAARERARSEADAAVATARSAAAEAVAALQRMRGEHESAAEAHDEASRELADLLDEVAAAERAQAEARQRCEALASELGVAESEAQRLQFAVRAAERERAELD